MDLTFPEDKPLEFECTVRVPVPGAGDRDLRVTFREYTRSGIDVLIAGVERPDEAVALAATIGWTGPTPATRWPAPTTTPSSAAATGETERGGRGDRRRRPWRNALHRRIKRFLPARFRARLVNFLFPGEAELPAVGSVGHHQVIGRLDFHCALGGCPQHVLG